jgi:hypothetical protein
MDRQISTIINKFSTILGFNSLESRINGMAILGFGLGRFLRVLGLRFGVGRMSCSCVTAVSCASTAKAKAVRTPVKHMTDVAVQHCWRPADANWNVSGKIIG